MKKSAGVGWPAEGFRGAGEGGSLQGLVLAGCGDDVGQGDRGVGVERSDRPDGLALDQVRHQGHQASQRPVHEHNEQGVLEVLALPISFQNQKNEGRPSSVQNSLAAFRETQRSVSVRVFGIRSP